MHDPEAQGIDSLEKLNKATLHQLWKGHFGTAPPPLLRRELMLPFLAYRLQEKRFGPISIKTRSRLRQLAKALESHSDTGISVMSTLKPGTRLVRQWRDQVHMVNVDNHGYEYQGIRYTSLSKIARQITGTRWSGPAFFGLKGDQSTQPKEVR